MGWCLWWDIFVSEWKSGAGRQGHHIGCRSKGRLKCKISCELSGSCNVARYVQNCCCVVFCRACMEIAACLVGMACGPEARLAGSQQLSRLLRRCC